MGPDGQIVHPRPAPPVALTVAEARQRLGLTVAELADELCVSERTVWRWLRGGRVPRSTQRLMELLVGAAKVTERGTAAHGPRPHT